MFYYIVSHKNLSLLDYEYSNSLNCSKSLFIDLYNNLSTLEKEYPYFRDWYKNLFNKDYTLKPDRKILYLPFDEVIAGFIILKKTKKERKICTLRVKEHYQKNGIAKELIKSGIEWFEDDKPLVTVSEYRSEQFKHLFKYFGFKLKDKINCYNSNVKEFFYNNTVDDYLYNKSKIISKPILDYKGNIILENEINNFYNFENKREIELKNQEYNYFNEIKNSNLYAAEYPTFQ